MASIDEIIKSGDTISSLIKISNFAMSDIPLESKEKAIDAEMERLKEIGYLHPSDYKELENEIKAFLDAEKSGLYQGSTLRYYQSTIGSILGELLKEIAEGTYDNYRKKFGDVL